MMNKLLPLWYVIISSADEQSQNDGIKYIHELYLQRIILSRWYSWFKDDKHRYNKKKIMLTLYYYTKSLLI